MVTVELRKPGRNGRLWLLTPRSADERAAIIAEAHRARCQSGLSYRRVVTHLAELGWRVSLGAAYAYASRSTCGYCTDVTQITTNGDG